MSALAQLAADYLALRRAVGFKLEDPGRRLAEFVAYLDERGETRVTTARAVEWAAQATTPGRAGLRLSAVRLFARFAQAHDPAHEVPPEGALPPKARHRPPPRLYTPGEVEAVMAAARVLRPALWAATCETAVGLLSVSGMRVGELLALERDDIDLEAGVATVWFAKLGKSRHVPLAASTVHALSAYDELRCRCQPSGFFVSRTGSARLSYPALHGQFVQLLETAGLPCEPRQRPRLHDFRHTFAVATMADWYRSGQDVQALLPRLSTYLGHSEPAATYWYLSAAPELMALAAERLRPPSPGGRP